MSLPIYVINLARAPERLASIGGQLDRQGLDWIRLDATDRLGADAAALQGEFGSNRAFPATLGDICCSLSHQRVWQAMIGSGADAAIVLEDDAILAEEFAALARADLFGLMVGHGMGVLKLEYWPGPQQSRRYPLGERLGPVPGQRAMTLYAMRSSFLGTCGYVITAEAARTVLGRFPAMRVPVDHYLFGAAAGIGFDLLRPGFLNPAPVLHGVARFGSDISAARTDMGLGEVPRSLSRRVRECWLKQRHAHDLRRGLAERVSMQFAGNEKNA